MTGTREAAEPWWAQWAGPARALPFRAALVAAGLAAGALSSGALTPGALTPANPAPGRGELGALDRDQAEIYAALLLDHPLRRAGDRDGLVAAWLDQLEAQPDHPLAEALLRLYGDSGPVEDPLAQSARLLAVDPGRLAPLAAHRLGVLQAEERLARDPPGSLTEDLFPTSLRAFSLLARGTPLDDPLGLLEDDAWLMDATPDLEQEVVGASGPVRWQPLPRSPLRRFVHPADGVDPPSGWALLTTTFATPRGGPGYIEIDLGSSGRLRRGWNGRSPEVLGNPSYAASVNGGAPLLVDRLGTRRGTVDRLPVVLREGLNRVTLKLQLEADPAVAVRVLDVEGRPWPGLSAATATATASEPLGAVVEAVPPPPLVDAETRLAGIADRGPFAEALLGLLAYSDRREPDGLALIRSAVAAAPDSVSLRSLLAAAVGGAGYLPEVTRRADARHLAEAILAEDPTHFAMGLLVAEALAGEDREEEALTLLQRLDEEHPHQTRALLIMQGLFKRLGMEAEAERTLGAALTRSPTSPRVLDRYAAHLADVGQDRAAADVVESAMRAAGVTPSTLVGLAQSRERLGAPLAAEALLGEAIARGGNRAFELILAAFLVRQERHGAAAAVLTSLCERYPDWVLAWSQRADAAVLRGDGADERLALQRLAQLVPADVAVRERLADRTAGEGRFDVDEFLRGFDVSAEEALLGYDESVQVDAVARVLDLAIVRVFEDGSQETWTHEIRQARDLEGAERLGRLRLPGEVVKVVTRDRDGSEHEPVLVGGEYIMPSLEPGDFVETITITRQGASRDGLVRPGRWFFQSVSESFHLSRWIVWSPRSIPLKAELRNIDDRVQHEVLERDEARVHVFEAREMGRVLPEPASPPPHWFLPWAELGQEDDPLRGQHRMRAAVVHPTRVTPELIAAAEAAVAGTRGQDAEARALYTAVGDALDRRQAWRGQTATETLLAREGPAPILYAALLEAVGIDHELVWSRNTEPAGDPEPDPVFPDEGWWQNKLYVVVRPDDGPEAWCDPDSATLPYGVLLKNSSGALGFGTRSGRLVTAPVAPPADRVGFSIDLEIEVDAESSRPGGPVGAAVGGLAEMTGGFGYVLKEQLQRTPTQMHGLLVAQVATLAVPGLDVSEFEFVGLDDEEPLWLQAAGRVENFLDDDGSRLVCPLPILPVDLSTQFSGEGRRTQPALLSEGMVARTRVLLQVPDTLELVDAPLGYSADLPNGHYLLAITPEGGGEWSIRRDLVLGPFALDAEDWAEFADACRRIDEAERARLRFARR